MLFLDTSGLIALSDKKMHNKAITYFREQVEKKPE